MRRLYVDKPPPQFFQRVVAFERFALSAAADRDGRAAGAQFQKRPGREDAVSPHFFTTDHAFEQTDAAAVVDLVQPGDRRECVAHQPPVNGHEVVIGGEFAKRFEIWQVHNNRPWCGDFIGWQALVVSTFRASKISSATPRIAMRRRGANAVNLDTAVTAVRIPASSLSLVAKRVAPTHEVSALRKTGDVSHHGIDR